MNTHSPQTSLIATHVPAWRQWMRRLYLLTAALIGVAVGVQVFWAGAAVLVDATYWSVHRVFGNSIEYLVLALLLIGLATRLPWRLQALGGIMYVLMFLQYFFLYLMPRIGVPLLRALHAVNALVLWSVALVLVFRVWYYLRRPNQPHG